MFRHFFGDDGGNDNDQGQRIQRSLGSGVIVDPSGLVVTINHDDFLDLASRQAGHPGVIVLPSAGPLVMGQLFTALLRSIESGATLSGQLIVVDLAGRIARIDVPSLPPA